MSEDRKAAILHAAREAFSRYGFSKTSMADVADLAGVSRPALYGYFRSREDLFRSMAASMCQAAMERAEEAWPRDAAPEEGLVSAVLAKELELFRLLRQSPHGAEILERSATLTRDLHGQMEAEFAALVTKRLGKRGAEGKLLGLVIARAMEGIKQGATTESEFVDGVKRLAAVLAPGLARSP